MIKSPVVLAESYAPPPLTDTLVQTRVVLAEGYTPPAIGATVLPCSGTVEPPPVGADAIGVLSATLAPPAIALTATAGGETVAPPADALGTLSAALPTPAPQITAAATGAALPSAAGAVSAYLMVVVPALSAAVSAEHYLDLPDAVGVGANARSQSAQQTRAGTAMGQQSAVPTRLPMSARTAQTLPAAVGSSARAGHMAQIINRASAPHQHGERVRGSTRQRWADTLRARRTAAARHQHGIPLPAGTQQGWADTGKPKQSIRAIHGTAPAKHALVLVVEYALRGVPALVPLQQDWTQAIAPPPGRWWPRYEAPLLSGTTLRPCNPNYVPRPLACPVVLGIGRVVQPPCDGDGGGEQPPGQIIVPIRRTYIVLNTLTLVRASDNAPLSALSLNLQIDADSWTWGWDASIPGAELALVEPAPGGDPVELLATVNGQQFRLLAERIARDRRFAQSRIRISGRGRAAMLADPHSPIVTRSNAQARTMQQLLGDALTINGVGIGWAVDWQAADWLVPAGLYSHTGSYIAHAQRLAEAAGAYVQADPLLDTLRILPRYPLLPWEWSAATPDITLPSAPVVREAIEWQDKAAYNRVFVSGTESGGVLGQITRTNTAGDVVAPMITDPLITHADAARARGRPILADTGRQARITLELPILPETGIITPGKLVQYTDAGTTRRGLVRSTAVTAQLPTARQTIELETHA